MPDPLSESQRRDQPSLLERLSALLMREPEDREQLLSMLHHAHERNLLDADALSMIEGVMQVSELSVRDVMVPRSQMDVIDIAQSPEEFIPHVIATAHSRFPVIESDRDHVIGILLAKDMLRHYAEADFNVRDMLRPATFIPESKRLNVLLREFRTTRNHIAIVVDEFGSVAGLVTIEDVLEQIVGDIEDEYDGQEGAEGNEGKGSILPADFGRWRVHALTGIEQFNTHFGTQLSADGSNTIGDLITSFLGRMPRRGESVRIENLVIEILRSDGQQLHMLLIEKITDDTTQSDN